MAEGSKDLRATANLLVLFISQRWMDPCFGWQAVPGQSEDGDHCPDSHLLFTKSSAEEGMVVVYPAPHPIHADSLILILPQLVLAGWNPCLGA